MVENNGVFPREAISTLCRLAGWSEKGGTWALYIKEVMERHLDTSACIWGIIESLIRANVVFEEGQMHDW